MAITPYEALVASASRLTETDALAGIDKDNISAASGFLEPNLAVLESARHALSQRCTVQVGYVKSFYPEHLNDISHFRNLARAFGVEALLAASSEDYITATRCGIDILELANAVRRGGLVTDLLVGIGISGIAIETLRNIRTKLDPITCQELISDLQRIEADREPFADIIARDCEWEIAVGEEDKTCDITSTELQDSEECGLSQDEQKELLQLCQQIADLPDSDRRKLILNQDQQILALMGLLVIDLALRASYELYGMFPDNLTSLTPRFLSKLPLDPFTGESLIYRPIEDTSFHLYSTGPKMFDGGGKFGPLSSFFAGCADLCLDVYDYGQDCSEIPRRKGLVYRVASSIKKRWREWRR